MPRPSNTRLARAAIIVVALGALMWIVALLGISLSNKETKERTPDMQAAPAGQG